MREWYKPFFYKTCMTRHLRLDYQTLFRKCARVDPREWRRSSLTASLPKRFSLHMATWRSLRGLNDKTKVSPNFLLRLSQLVLLPLSCSCKIFSTYREILILNLISCNTPLQCNRPGDTWLSRGGGHLGISWVGMCPPGLQIGTPF